MTKRRDIILNGTKVGRTWCKGCAARHVLGILYRNKKNRHRKLSEVKALMTTTETTFEVTIEDIP